MPRLSRNVLLLALTSLLADVSGELLMAVLPFLLVAQGAGGLALGLVGGVADGLGHLVRPLSGWVADRTRRRRPLIVAGYLTAALARVGIALAPLWQGTLLLRAVDRVGKGVRTAPRDALLAESAPAAQRGRAFGVHRAADTSGAFVGVAIALALLTVAGWSPASIVLLAGAVGLTTLAPLLFVREIEAPAAGDARFAEAASPRYARFLAVAAVLAAGNVSYLFYMLRARDAAGGEAGAVALYLWFNLVYAAAAYPLGGWGDRVGKGRVLAAGFLLFSASAAAFLLPPALPTAVAGFALLGLAFASVDGTERALAADLAGSAARGTRLGLFSASVGIANLLGGLVAGLLWDRVGPAGTFAYGAALPLLALALLVAGGFTAAGSRATRPDA